MAQINKETWVAVGVASGAVLLAIAVYGLMAPKNAIPAVQKWNTKPIRALQGVGVTVSFPRGESFVVASPDIEIQAQVQQGNESHLVLRPKIVNQPEYRIVTTVIDRTTTRVYPIELLVKPIENYIEGAAPGNGLPA